MKNLSLFSILFRFYYTLTQAKGRIHLSFWKYHKFQENAKTENGTT